MAFVKRFCQVLVSGFGGSEFVAGGLWLLGEVSFSGHLSLNTVALTRSKLFNTSQGLRGLVDRAPTHGAEVEEYDPYKREPQYAHAQSSALWELVRCPVGPTVVIPVFININRQL